MTAPIALSGFSDITTQIAAIQSTLASLSAPARTAATGNQFSAALSSASSSHSTNSSSLAAGTGATGANVVADAKKYLGVPYVWGGESKSGIDCSGLVQASFGDLGVKLPRTAAEQQQVGQAVPSLSQAQPGDLLFFGQPAYHVAIYLGNNQLIESPEPGKTVHITNVYQAPTSIRRIAAPDASLAAAPAGALSAAQLTAAGMTPAVASFAGQFASAEAQYHLPAGLLAAVAQQESGGNAQAVSPAGAQGLMQLMPSTAAGMGVNALDPTQAIDAAAKILSGSLTKYNGSVPLALAAYNAGAGAVAQYGGIPPYSETQNYVRSITAMMERGA
jgi:cell wall-associated NlpC family hydrolase